MFNKYILRKWAYVSYEHTSEFISCKNKQIYFIKCDVGWGGDKDQVPRQLI